MLLAAACNKRD